MVIHTTTVATPNDTPSAYDWDWRAKAVKAMLSEGVEVCAESSDNIIRLYKTYRLLMKKDDFRKIAENPHWDEAFDMFEGLPAVIKACRLEEQKETTQRIEALLLCENMSLGQIGEVFGLTAEVVETYSKLFYDVRDEQGFVRYAKGVREHLMLKGTKCQQKCSEDSAGHWRVLAFEGGHKVLFANWGWPADHIVPEFTDIDVQVNLLRGAYKNLESAVRLGRGINSSAVLSMTQDVVSRFEKLRKGGIVSATEHIPDSHIIMKVLQLIDLAPAEESEEALAEINEQLTDKLTTMNNNKDVAEEEEEGNESMAGILEQMNNL